MVTSLLHEIMQARFRVGKLAILFMTIRWPKMQNFAWERGLSDSAYLKYAKKSLVSQLLPKKCL